MTSVEKSLEYTEYVDCCTTCGLPMLETPDTVAMWKTRTLIGDCPDGDHNCPGHVTGLEWFCVNCQAQGKQRTR